jgi:hypothetical protein
MLREEQPTKGGLRRIVISCPQCFRFELELRTRGGLLVLWRHGVLNRPLVAASS